MVAYFDEPDSTGHEFGPDSPQVAKSVKRMDGILGQVMTALEKSQKLRDKVSCALIQQSVCLSIPLSLCSCLSLSFRPSVSLQICLLSISFRLSINQLECMPVPTPSHNLHLQTLENKQRQKR